MKKINLGKDIYKFMANIKQIKIGETIYDIAATSFDGVLPIEKGGTGADDRIHAINNLISLPYNTEPTADTPAEWVKFGSFICYYSSGTSVINKPSSYGTLIQIVAPSSTGDLSTTTIQQIWMRQGYGYVFTRAGNATGWNGSEDLSGANAWKRFYDNSSTIPIANGGTGATTVAGAIAKLSDNKLTLKEDNTLNGVFNSLVINGIDFTLTSAEYDELLSLAGGI